MKRSKQTKKALTGSVLALVLCFVMLLGTTFAWFTDTASTKVNTIQAGTLGVALLVDSGKTDTDGNVKWASAEGQELKFKNKEGGDEIFWEPGATFTLPQIKIVNEGNLALKYKVVIAAVSGDTKLAEVLNVSLQDGTREAQSVGTLKDLLSADYAVIDKPLAANSETDPLTISVTMDSKAGNEYQGKKIEGIAITVFATQATVEYDSYTDQYDKDATYDVEVSSIDALRKAINDPTVTEIKLAGDIALSSVDCYKISDSYGYTLLIAKTSVDIDLNGHVISYKRNASGGDVNARFGIVATNGATVNVYDSSASQTGGITIDDDEAYCLANNLTSSGYALYAENGATLNVYGGNYVTSNGVVVYSQGKTANGYASATINLYGGTYKSSYYSGAEGNILNIQNGCSSRIHVYGGSYYDFQPGVNNAGEAILANGFKVERSTSGSDTWYTVVPEINTSVNADTTFDMGGQTITLGDFNEAYVMSSDNRGAKITLKNATYTGEAQGIYFGEYLVGGGTYSFNTQADNVTVENLTVSTGVTNGNNEISAGVWVYGAFELNNCKMSGTTTVADGCTPYDVIFVNQSHGTVNGGEYDSMFVYTSSEVRLKGVKVGKIACMTNTRVGKALTIDKDCVIGTLEFVGSPGYVMNVTIEDGAQIGSIVYNGQTYTVDTWKAYVAGLTT